MFIDMFAGAHEEMLVVCFLGKYGGILSRSVVTNYEKSAISFNLSDIANEINRIRPDSIIIAHNHLSGNPNPSIADNMATKRIAILLNVHGVNFYDHLIFCGRDYFSYHLTGRLEKIKEEVRHTVNGNIDYNV